MSSKRTMSLHHHHLVNPQRFLHSWPAGAFPDEHFEGAALPPVHKFPALFGVPEELSAQVYQGAVAQGLHDAAHLQYPGVVVMQIEDDLGTPEQIAERWAPCRIVSNVHTQSFCFQYI